MKVAVGLLRGKGFRAYELLDGACAVILFDDPTCV